MPDVTLFRVRGGDAVEIPARGGDATLRGLVAANAEAMLGVTALATDYPTGSRHGGRIVVVGLDENAAPTVVEVASGPEDGVLARGVYFLDWLVDHRADLRLLVSRRRGPGADEVLDWAGARLIAVAAAFTRYDIHLAEQLGRPVDLVRCTRLEDDLLTLEHLTRGRVDRPDATATVSAPGAAPANGSHAHAAYRTVSQDLDDAPETLRGSYAALADFVEGLGADVTRRVRDTYVAFRRLRNFTCVEVDRRENALLLYLRLDPDSVEIDDDFTRDVSRLGHFGTGYLEVRVTDAATLARALPLVRASYANG